MEKEMNPPRNEISGGGIKRLGGDKKNGKETGGAMLKGIRPS